MIVLIIYIIGCIIYIPLDIYYTIKNDNEIYVIDIIRSIIFSLFSWIGVILIIIVEYGDIVIYKKK